MIFTQAGATSDDLFELGHGLDALIQDDEFTGLGIDACGHELGGGDDDGVGAFGVDEVVEFGFADRVVSSNAHDVAPTAWITGRTEAPGGVDQGVAHSIGMFGIFAKDDGFGVGVVVAEEFHDFGGDQFGALFEHKGAIEVLLVVDSIGYGGAVFVGLVFAGSPTLEVAIEVEADDFVGREEAVFDALGEGVGVDRFAEVVGVGNVFGFFGGGGEADLGGAAEVGEDVAPSGVFGGATAMAFVDHDEIKEVGGELFVDVLGFFGACDCLVEGEIDFVGFIDLAFGDFGHGRAEGGEVVLFGLIDEDVAIGEKQDPFFGAGFPESPDDLEGGEGFAGAGGHDEDEAIAALGDRFERLVDGVDLVVAGQFAAAVAVVVLGDQVGAIVGDAFVQAVFAPELGGAGEFGEGDFGFGLVGVGGVVEDEAVAVAAEGEGDVEHFGVFKGLLHSLADRFVVVFGFDHGDRQVGFVEEDVVGAFGFTATDQFAAHDDASGGELDFFADLGVEVPTGGGEGGGDVFGADVAFGEVFFVEHDEDGSRGMFLF